MTKTKTVTTRRTQNQELKTTWGRYVQALCLKGKSPMWLVDAETPRPHRRIKVRKDRPDQIRCNGQWTEFTDTGLEPSDFPKEEVQ